MNHLVRMRCKPLIASALLSLPLLAGLHGAAHAAELYRVDGVAVTGSNRLLGRPLWDLGENLGNQAGFTFVYGYNPGASLPFEIDETSSPDTILASGFDVTYLALFGLTPDDLDPSLINVPLHQIPVLSTPDDQRSPLPMSNDVAGDVRSRAAFQGPITLGQWLGGKGRANIRCRDDGTAHFDLRLSGLLPGGLYTFWGVWSFDRDGDGVGDVVGGVPLGGVPNMLVADDQGKASARRDLNFCPQHETRLKYLTVAYHSELRGFGAVPDQALDGAPGGTTAHAAVSFPINAVPVY